MQILVVRTDHVGLVADACLARVFDHSIGRPRA
jgi:hypothetical protein